jgi:protein-S-isoprenylcysteine O-methyltransferase Ste14
MTWKRYAEIAARVRVPTGFVVLALYAVFARPTWPRFWAGALLALAGLALRAYAAGHLAKNRQLAVSGPYAFTRNPLYLGSALAAAGFAIAGGSWWLGLLWAAYFFLLFLPVVAEEEAHLAKLFPEFRQYAAAVPRFAPRLRPARFAGHPGSRFCWSLYWRNQEYNALLGYVAGIALLVWKLR